VHATIAGVLIGLLTPIDFQNKKRLFSPLEDLVHYLHPWVSFVIMPIFALANAGVSLKGVDLSVLGKNAIFQGVALGLFLGKPLGIVAFAWLATKMKVAQLPRGVDWGDMLGVGFLGGIGFTMALFVSSLALYPEQELFSKTGILVGSALAALLGSVTLVIAFRKNRT
jgi:NhaA family Na+:H+ antiporter